MANSRAFCFIRAAATVTGLGRGLSMSPASVVAPPELRRRQVADWETRSSPIISVLPGHPTRIGSDDATGQLRFPEADFWTIDPARLPRKRRRMVSLEPVS